MCYHSPSLVEKENFNVTLVPRYFIQAIISIYKLWHFSVGGEMVVLRYSVQTAGALIITLFVNQVVSTSEALYIYIYTLP